MGKNRIFFARWTPAIYWSLVSKPWSQDIQSICYCLHPGIFRLDTRDLLVAVVPISISSKYLYLYLALKVLTCRQAPFTVSQAEADPGFLRQVHQPLRGKQKPITTARKRSLGQGNVLTGVLFCPHGVSAPSPDRDPP